MSKKFINEMLEMLGSLSVKTCMIKLPETLEFKTAGAALKINEGSVVSSSHEGTTLYFTHGTYTCKKMFESESDLLSYVSDNQVVGDFGNIESEMYNDQISLVMSNCINVQVFKQCLIKLNSMGIRINDLGVRDLILSKVSPESREDYEIVYDGFCSKMNDC